ncbi:hypothetical protein GLAREA_05673 [Glarea lozoyensis ATCC 20868]|uniref:CFEM domain-containing protein n=1 Tax=Glarea lozoyensis (strain ATCC 20868 / MF5171) TaxID=1116229 RepID=S3DF24_GLAL2|nr:uncharacterized protein GLAREA_05673 [Glarea lozoyensis ATCC 20868]EPE36335.1 hypothetical protein GLAREA_05673 [Glarea lozoyensis ATCC 20868]
MPLSNYLALLAVTLSFLPFSTPQLLNSLPSCIVDCINNSPDTNCSLLDISCLCRASAGNFLTDTVTCMRAQCDNSLNTNVLLSPLQLACQLAGSPIPASAIRNAEIVASQLQGVVTTTVTAGASPSSTPQSPTNVQVTTTTVQSLMTSTVTQTTTRDGNVLQSVVPVIVGQGTTRFGSGSAVSSISTSSSNSGNGGVGGAVIITTTNQAGSTFTTTTSAGGAVVITTTNSAGSTFTTTSRSSTRASSSQSNPSQSLSSTGANGLSTLSGTQTPPTSSQTSANTPSTSTTSSQDSERTSNPDDPESNSAPFRNTNTGTRDKEPGSLFAMSVAMVGLCVWL